MEQPKVSEELRKIIAGAMFCLRCHAIFEKKNGHPRCLRVPKMGSFESRVGKRS